MTIETKEIKAVVVRVVYINSDTNEAINYSQDSKCSIV